MPGHTQSILVVAPLQTDARQVELDARKAEERAAAIRQRAADVFVMRDQIVANRLAALETRSVCICLNFVCAF